MAKVTLALVHDLIKKQTETFIAEITSLRDEVAAFKAQLAATNLTSSPQSTPAQPSSFADVVKTSIRSALEEDRAKQEVIIQRLPENTRDVADVHEICARAEVIVKPTAVTRLGKSHPNRPLALEDAFPSDHKVLYFNVALSLPIVSKHTRNVFNFKRANLTMLQSKLNRLSECFNEDLDDISVWTSWSDDVLEISKQCIPKVRVRSSNDPPCFDSEARHLVNQQRTLWRKAKRVNPVNA
ncbi:hypothetical protein CAPTEDRAFT_198361 [Capitella teleta]|uniref:Uncharacterized protein n=1 Tax=Capitella teleta TaxID=283909 RepID=R7V106_CAPTE|nr:hypothetical protein CAPTEDRAFT_198361 [Capitella teleta]|eukprot:ELU09907.1 hypothetical protein CAPTEDRAFT_198361 [Capitella teleta]